MYSVYAVRLKNGQKNRFYIDTFDSLEEAKHVCNCYTCGNADYAYVKEIGSGGTVFFLKAPASYYDEGPLDPAARQVL